MRIQRRLVLAAALLLTTGKTARAEDAVRWHQETGFQWAALAPTGERKSGFALLPPVQTGLAFTNSLEEQASAANRILLNGAGVAAGDFNNDGLADIFLCSLSGHSALFKNLGGMKFEDVTIAAGLTLSNRVTRGAVFADLNGDGWLDLLVSTLANGVACFLNDGHGQFTETTVNAGTGSSYGSCTLALADVDGNGTLDLYVANYRSEDIRDRGRVDLQMVKGKMVVPPKLRDRFKVIGSEVLEFGEPDQLLLNDGHGRFTPVSWSGGTFLDEDGQKLTEPPLDWGLTASFRDLNQDGWPDLYVCNDYWTPDRIWINDGTGRFRALPRLALRETCSSSMGVDFADVDRDGFVDIMVTDMLSRDPQLRRRQMPPRWPIPEPKEVIAHRSQIIQNTMFHNRGDNTYEEIANFANVAASDWSWQPIFLDIDLDGYPDLLIPAGHARDVQDMDAERQIRSLQHSWRGFTNAVEQQKAFTHELMMHMRLYPRLDMPIFAFRNTGHLQFQDMTAEWGTAQLGVHHSMALADFDNDGDLDLIVNNLGSGAALYQNVSLAPRVAVRLRGLSPNTQGIGSHIELRNGAIPLQTEEVVSGGHYMAGSDSLVVFAAGPSTNRMDLTVHWRSGQESVVQGVVANRVYEIQQPPPGEVALPRQDTNTPRKALAIKPAPPPPLFEDVSAALNHRHQEAAFDEFARQPLLPKKLSQLGPGVSWFDLNEDGWDDLIIASGRGGSLSAFLNDQHGGFQPFLGAPFNAPVTRDQTAIIGLTTPNGRRLLVVGSSNYEDGLAAGAAARIYDLHLKRLMDSLPGQLASTGPIAAADYDGDGDLDLFIGGRCLPGRYPEAASSLILRQTPSGYEIDPENTRVLKDIGLVSGAVWSDLDDDGFPELILACEWGPVRVFGNRSGVLREVTAELGLGQITGWWSGVTTGDLNGDGHLDIVAGNWGLNSLYKATAAQPLRLYFGDLARRETVDLIEAEYDPMRKDYLPRQRPDQLTSAMPFLSGRFPTAKAFSQANIAALPGPGQPQPTWVEAKSLSSTLFLNRGKRFEAVPLGREAQLSPVSAVVVADFNGDGHEDLFLSQNFFGTAPEMPRQDAGRGLLLLGDGPGALRAIPGQESGVLVYGEQRGAAVADFDQDGRVDLVVTQNSEATKLYRNRGAVPGLRVRLVGPPGNVAGIGATLRLITGGQAGPAKQIQAGSGYWSQDSSVVVLAAPKRPEALWIRWPGGKITTTSIPERVREIAVDTAGKIMSPQQP